MKHILTLVLVLVLYSVNAQYEFTVSNELYQNLENATSINNGDPWEDPTYSVPIGFDFQLGSLTFNTLYFIEDGGALITSPDFEVPPVGGFIPVLQPIVDRGINTGVSVSPLSYRLLGSPGNYIFIIEWNNVGFIDEVTLQDFINFQLWLYEDGSVIEYRYGPSVINDPDSSFDSLEGLQIGLFPLLPGEDTGGGGTLEEAVYFLSGDAVNPELIVITTFDELDAIEDVSIIGTPPTGTIYRFTPEVLGTPSQSTGLGVNVFPNPTRDLFTIDSADMDYTLELYTVSGQQVRSFGAPQNFYSIATLQKGVYFLKIISPKGVVTKRLIKQ
jgi:hypothetical protein